MLRYIDHVILGVNDLDDAAHDYARVLGFAVSAGGVHPGMGTQNRLIVLDPTYVELIARVPGVEVSPSSPVGSMLTRSPGAIGFALASDDVEADTAAMKERGLSVDGPTNGRLEWAPGEGRGWRTARLRGLEAWRLPFIIQHDAEGEERLRRIAAPDLLQPHPNGVTGVDSITVAVHDLDAGLETYRRAFGLTAKGAFDDPLLEACTARLPLTKGAIVLAAPLAEGRGPVAAALAARGEGMVRVALAVDDLASAVAAMRDEGLEVDVDGATAHLAGVALHGAWLDIVASRGGAR